MSALKILFIGEAVTLSHIARPLQLAKMLDSKEFDITFACDPRSHWMLNNLPFKVRELASISSEQFLTSLEKVSPVYSADILRRYVMDDLALIRDVRPDVIVGDFRLSLSVSARVAGVPYINITNAHWSRAWQGKLIVPPSPVVKIVGTRIGQFFLKFIFPIFSYFHSQPVNTVRKEYKLAPLKDDVREVYTDGDAVLYADDHRVVRTENRPANHFYAGPITWSPAMGLPWWWDNVPTDKPVVFLNLGSSGDTTRLADMINTLADLNVSIMVATAGRIKLNNVPANVFAADFIPGSYACDRANLVITNGGSLGTYQALQEGKPVIGIATNMDQLLNMENIVKAGLGLCLRNDSFSTTTLKAAVEKALSDRAMAIRCQIIGDEMLSYANGETKNIFLNVIKAVTKTETVLDPKKEWDAIIVGTGMGGATLGYQLAKTGKSVLFIERGKSHLKGLAALKGKYAETFGSKKEHLEQAGRYADSILDVSGKNPIRFVPFIGAGTGGSTALYGAVLERLHPEDFKSGAWPISYAEMTAHYEAAELLYGLGREPLPLSECGEELFKFFRKKHLQPYRLPIATDTAKKCQLCQGFICDKGCKKDSASVCLKPAIENFGATLLDECEVLKINSSKRRVDSVVFRRKGKVETIYGKNIVVAAGALETPRLLLLSAGPDWPDGLANGSGLVGKNLMRHFLDLYLVFTRSIPNETAQRKEIAFNDFYTLQGERFGTVQSFGVMPPANLVAWPFLAWFLNFIFKRCVVLASIMEDAPQINNQVTLSRDEADRLAFSYNIARQDQSKIEAFRSLITRTLRPYRFIRIKQAENNERLAHACGTCRFGNDEATSVLDKNCKAHGISNLYVVDGSFFPTSGGINPALTIAANALRVAEHMIKTWESETDEVSDLSPQSINGR